MSCHFAHFSIGLLTFIFLLIYIWGTLILNLWHKFVVHFFGFNTSIQILDLSRVYFKQRMWYESAVFCLFVFQIGTPLLPYHLLHVQLFSQQIWDTISIYIYSLLCFLLQCNNVSLYSRASITLFQFLSL